jgi:gliding motility-associated-like protein
MTKLKRFLTTIFTLLLFFSVSAQITAPLSSGSFQTTYSTPFISSGGQNDIVYVFCGDQDETDIGQLSLSAPGCIVTWYHYDGNSFVSLGVTGEIINNLPSGFYMARKDCSGTIECYRAWVWVNRTFADIAAIPPGCETFNLNGQAEVLDNTYDINDPPGSDFIVDANTYIKVCFWANHTFVSDIGFYLKSPGNQTANPPAVGVVQLCPAASDWGPSAAQGSWTGIPWSALGCSSASDENTVCNSGDNVNSFCFRTHAAPGGAVIPAGSPANTPCVCDLGTPLTGNFASVGPWSTIYGSHAANPGWSVQIYDCEGADVGALTRATIQFVGETDCGTATFNYDSGPINSSIADNSCSASTASLYIVPPGEPIGTYTVTSSISSTVWSTEPSGFSGTSLTNTIVEGTPDFPTTSTDFILTVTETINVPNGPSCQTIVTEPFETLPADATITPVNPMCSNSAPVQLTTVDGGGVWTTTAPSGSIVGGYFYPGVAGPGTYTVTYTISGPCEDSDEITIVVYDNISVLNFSDDICSGDNTQYFVSFDVENSLGNPSNYYVDLGLGDVLYTTPFSQTFPSGTQYHITVTDANDCSEYIFNGYTLCDCETNAGNMTSLIPINLCQTECSDMVHHNGDQSLDTDDTFEFIIHDGNYPANIFAYNTTPEFCFTDIPGGQYGVIYYISAICGNNVGGHVSQIDPCYSQSIGTPVVWYENPIAHITESELSVCNTSIILEATPPTGSMSGSWSSPDFFVPFGGTTVNDPTINVMSNYGDVTFTWSIYNGFCSGSDNILVHFNETPTAYAGEDYTICGNEGGLNAIFSLPGSSGQWTGPGMINESTLENTTVLSNYGTQIFTWTETQGICSDNDFVSITFLPEPNPYTIDNFDTVCLNSYNLHVYNVNDNGNWTAYSGDPLTLLTPAPIYSPNNTDPNAMVTIGNYPGLYKDVVFVWTETNQSNGVTCTNEASVSVTFAKQPIASVGASDEAEICGNCFTFNADITGSEWAIGSWIGKDIISTFDDISLPNATVCIDPLGSYGDTAYVRTSFLWTMTNYGCTDIDTMWITFYKQPNANAGLDNAICGHDYTLGAVYDFTENGEYAPSGSWSTLTKPFISSVADIENQYDDTTNVGVSDYGIYEFTFRENNSNLTSCYDVDTVQIEFIELPIISAGEDKDECGTSTILEGVSGGFTGSWVDNGAVYSDYTDPNSSASINIYGPVTFTWLESNQSTTTSLSCTSIDDVVITFWAKPTANILTDLENSTVCGYTFENLRAENPGSGITGYWYNINPATTYTPNAFANNNVSVTVPTYGYHDFYWIEQTGPQLTPGFCNDTAGPLTILFIETPMANAGLDTTFCGYSGGLSAIPSIGSGVWNTPSMSNVSFSNINDPNSIITSTVLGTITIGWIEDNTNECTDQDEVTITFARIPTSDITVIPPKCYGEIATISADEDSLQQYTWNFFGGINDYTFINDLGADYRHFIHWTNDDTHTVSLITTNYWNCQSPINMVTVEEPLIPEFDVTLISDTCSLDKGGIVFNDTETTSFFWLNNNVGPDYNTPITSVYNIPQGIYDIRTSYLSPNTLHYTYYITTFGTANCIDTIQYEILPIGMIDADFAISADIILEDLIAPNASVIFINTSDYDDISKRCEWHFDDGTILKNCDPIVEHIYTESGCYNPFLIVMNRDLSECRDTAILQTCINVDEASKIEIPNIFSPNGDGTNDFFQVKANSLRSFNGEIYNRWGRMIYTWTDWANYNSGWNGKIKGSDASTGVYYYIIVATGQDGKEYDYHGVFHIVNEK